MMECSFVAFRESHQYLFLQLASFCSLHCLRSTASDRELQWRKKRAKSPALIPSRGNFLANAGFRSKVAKWEPVHLLTPWKVSATGGAWSRSWHFAWLPASGGPFSRGAFFFRMGRGPSGCGTSQPLWRTLSHLSWWIQRRWRKDSFFFPVGRNGGGDSEFSLFHGCFFFLRCFLEHLLKHHRSSATHCFLK